MRSLASRFAHNRSATSAIEFALILPIMFLLMAGTAEYSNYSRAVRRTAAAAQLTAQLVAAQTGKVDYINQIWNNSVLGINNAMPEMNVTVNSVIRATSVEVVPGSGGLNGYQANVIFTAPNWMYPLNRQCGQLTASDATPIAWDATSATILPTRFFQGGSSVIVVDLVYLYQPLFGSQFFPYVWILKQGFAVPLHVGAEASSLNNYGGEATLCAGYN